MLAKKQLWKDSGISSFEGFFKRSDGKVEIEAFPETDDYSEKIVSGEYYDQVIIVSEKEAWDILFDSDDFREIQ